LRTSTSTCEDSPARNRARECFGLEPARSSIRPPACMRRRKLSVAWGDELMERVKLWRRQQRTS
jgi:hypothetical protein